MFKGVTTVYIRVKIESMDGYKLMVHNPTLADPLHPTTRRYKELTSLKGKAKTDEVLKEIAEIEYKAGLYLNSNGNPCLPARNIKGACQHAGKKSNNGKLVREVVQIMEQNIDLEYDGPKTADELWSHEIKTADKSERPFVHAEQVKVDAKRITRYRPVFSKWRLTFHFYFDETLINESTMKDIIETLGTRCGIAECRPDYGRFILLEFKQISRSEALKWAAKA